MNTLILQAQCVQIFCVLECCKAQNKLFLHITRASVEGGRSDIRPPAEASEASVIIALYGPMLFKQLEVATLKYTNMCISIQIHVIKTIGKTCLLCNLAS